MNPSQLISHLNAIRVGDLDTIHAKLAEARSACLELEQEALVEQIDEASEALRRGDVRLYRKRLATVISRLGHVR
jgi:hypothetical protein